MARRFLYEHTDRRGLIRAEVVLGDDGTYTLNTRNTLIQWEKEVDYTYRAPDEEVMTRSETGTWEKTTKADDGQTIRLYPYNHIIEKPLWQRDYDKGAPWSFDVVIVGGLKNPTSLSGLFNDSLDAKERIENYSNQIPKRLNEKVEIVPPTANVIAVIGGNEKRVKSFSKATSGSINGQCIGAVTTKDIPNDGIDEIVFQDGQELIFTESGKFYGARTSTGDTLHEEKISYPPVTKGRPKLIVDDLRLTSTGKLYSRGKLVDFPYDKERIVKLCTSETHVIVMSRDPNHVYNAWYSTYNKETFDWKQIWIGARKNENIGCVDVSCGNGFLHLVASDGKLYAFGNNEYGNCCVNAKFQDTMKSIKCPDRITQVYTKDRFTLAISDNGKAYNCGFVASSERRLHHLTQLTLPKDVGPILRGAVSSDSAVLITSRNEVLAFGNVAKPGMVLMDVTMAPRVYIVRNKYVEKLVENFKTKREYKLRVRMSEDVTILFFALSNVELQIALTFR